MADNVTVGGVLYGTDDVGGAQIQRVKNTFGADGVATDVSATSPLPIYDPDAVATGTITAGDAVVTAPSTAPVSGVSTAGSYVSLPTEGCATWSVQITNNSGAATLYFESSLDSTDGLNGNWVAAHLRQLGSTSSALSSSTGTSSGVWQGVVGGARYVRVRSSPVTPSPAPALVLRGSAGAGSVNLATGLPAGTNQIGTVGLVSGTSQIGTIGEMRAATLGVTVTAAANTITTLTLPAVASQFHYITGLTIDLYSSAARTGAAAPVVVTSTNLPGTPAWTFSTAGAIGAIDRYIVQMTTPIKSSVVNTATTVVGPAVSGGIWRINCSYFTAV